MIFWNYRHSGGFIHLVYSVVLLRLSLSLSQQHLEPCQRQLLIKPGVLEPWTIYFSRHKHSFPQVLLILLIMLPNMPDNVWYDVLFVSVRWYNGTIKEHVFVARLIKPQTHGSSWSSGAWKSVKFMCRHLWNMQLGTFPAVCRMFYSSASVLQSHVSKSILRKLLLILINSFHCISCLFKLKSEL